MGRNVQLLERDEELDVAATLVAEAAEGRGRALAVLGPAGIGKTELLGAIRRKAHDEGSTVLAARGAELEVDLAFGVARQLLETTLERAEPVERRHLLRGPARLAEPLVADVAGVGAPPAADAAFAALHGLYWLVANLAEEAPVVVSVDDAHWADAASLRFLAYLAGRLEGLSVLVVIGARPAEPAAESQALQAITTDPHTVVVRPAPLSQSAVAELVVARLGEGAEAAFSAACHRATGGNPFLVRELLATLVTDGVAPVTANAARVAELGPASISRAVLARLARMTPPGAALAQAVAVLGVNARLDDAAHLAGLDHAGAAEAADALIAAEVLRPGQALDFVHPIVRAAIDDDMASVTRGEAHARAARLLAERTQARSAVAAHLLAAPPAGNRWVVDRLRQEAVEALGRAVPDVAVTYLERALSEPPLAGDRHLVLRELGVALATLGDHDRSTQVLAEALAATEDPHEHAMAARALAGVLVLLPGTARAAVELLDEAVAKLADDDAELGLDLEGDISSAALISLQARKAGLARTPRFCDPDDPRFLAHAALRHAMYQGPADESARLARLALAGGALLARESADSPTYWQAVLALLFAQDLSGAHAMGTEGLEEARRRSSAVGVGLASCFRARAGVQLGELSKAEADGRTYVELPGDALAVGPAFLLDALVAQGELDAAEAALDASVPSSERTDLAMFHFLLVSRAGLRLAQGDVDAGLEDLYECARGLEEWDASNPWIGARRTPGSIQWRPQAAEALATVGETTEARRLIQAELEACRAFAAPTTLGLTLRVAGLVEGGEDGIGLLSEAVATLASSPARLEHARALVDLGAALRRAGHRSEARPHLGEGLVQARRCGATALAERAHHELTATGARPRKILRTGAHALTASERRVAEMATTGSGNREIAQALFVTVRTVETHLHRTYLKLGISSRDDLPAALAE